MAGVTNLLSQMIEGSAYSGSDGDQVAGVVLDLFHSCTHAKDALPFVNDVYLRHMRALSLFCAPHDTTYALFQQLLLHDLSHIVNSLDCVRLAQLTKALSYLIGYGELWNRRLFAIALRTVLDQNSSLVLEIDSREVIVSVEADELEARQRLNVSKLHKEQRRPPPHCSVAAEDHILKSSFLPCLCRSDFTDETQSLLPDHLPHTCDEEVLYTLESAINSTHQTPSATPANGTYLDQWPLPSPNQFPQSYWPVLAPNTSQTSFPGIEFEASYKNLRTEFQSAALRQLGEGVLTERLPGRNISLVLVAQGFVCKTSCSGRVSNLGRNGSDTSAVAYGVMLRAEGCTIWSDVEGIYSADPRICPDGILLNSVSYDEAMELASFGAKVLHPACLLPAHHIKMPLLLKSTFKPHISGTLITELVCDRVGKYGKTLTRLGGVTLMTIQNRSFVPKFMSRLFVAVEESGSVPLLVSQSSTCSAVTLGLRGVEEESLLGQLVRVFKYDVSRGASIELKIERDCTLLCVTGCGQSGHVGALAAWCDALAQCDVSIKAVSQSSNELSTCFAVKSTQEPQALRSLHQKILEKLCTPPDELPSTHQPPTYEEQPAPLSALQMARV